MAAPFKRWPLIQSMEHGYAKEEVKRLRTQLSDLRGKLGDLEGRVGGSSAAL